MTHRPLRIAFIHPDLGIGGAERLVVDAALGLQHLGHSVDIYTSYHDPGHSFEETRDGSLNVRYFKPPFPRSLMGKFHKLFADLRQLHLTLYILLTNDKRYDVYFVDQLSTCVPFLRILGRTRVVFYCHFPDKLLANGAFLDGTSVKQNLKLLKRIYRGPMDMIEEVTTRQADVILANSLFTARVFKSFFPSIKSVPRVIYPGIHLAAYEAPIDLTLPEVIAISSSRSTLLSLNRFEEKKNLILALESFSIVLEKREGLSDLRLVLAGGYDPRLKDNVRTLSHLVSTAISHSLTYNIISPHLPSSILDLLPAQVPKDPQITFLLNFTTAQRSALLSSPSTLALLYTPANEHFGIAPIEAMACGIPVLACNSGGPMESIVSSPPHEAVERTGWLREPLPDVWAECLMEIVSLDDAGRQRLSECAKRRAREKFSMEAMAEGLEGALRDAEAMGEVDSWLFELLRVMIVVMVGFLLAYFASPLLIQR